MMTINTNSSYKKILYTNLHKHVTSQNTSRTCTLQYLTMFIFTSICTVYPGFSHKNFGLKKTSFTVSLINIRTDIFSRLFRHFLNTDFLQFFYFLGFEHRIKMLYNLYIFMNNFYTPSLACLSKSDILNDIWNDTARV